VPIDARARFRTTAVQTASKPQLVVMCYQRLLRDIQDARLALHDGDRYRAHTAIVHAQDIVAALQSALDHAAWDGAARLDALYEWVQRRLLEANVHRQTAALDEALLVVEPLAEAWAQAAQQARVAVP
jgi:flagellar protein FliS